MEPNITIYESIYSKYDNYGFSRSLFGNIFRNIKIQGFELADNKIRLENGRIKMAG